MEPVRTASGAFQRTVSLYRDHISASPDAAFPPVSGRYHLYISLACPWACRCYAMLKLKKLEPHIGVSITHPVWARTKPDVDSHNGWVFRAPTDEPVVPPSGHGFISCEGCIPDTVNHSKNMRELYELSPGTTERYTVPVLWDKEKKQIVNNESAEIVRILNSEFNKLEGVSAQDFYPEHLRAAIDEVNTWVYDSINNGNLYLLSFQAS